MTMRLTLVSVQTHAPDFNDAAATQPTAPTSQPGPAAYGATNLALGATPNGFADYQEHSLHAQTYGPLQHPSSAAYYNVHQRNDGSGYYADNLARDNPHLDPLGFRKRANAEALDQIIAVAKRQHMNPATFDDLGQRFLALESLELPINTAAPAYHSSAAVAAGGYSSHPSLQTSSQPAFESLKSRSDLKEVNEFLAELESHIYDQAHILGAANGARDQYVSAGNNASQQASAAPALGVTSAQSCYTATPALTPASTNLSHSSGNSPVSIGSTNGIPPPQQASGGLNYPALPATNISARSNVTYPASTLRAPVPNLGPLYDLDNRRHYSSGMLQRAADLDNNIDAERTANGDDHDHAATKTGNDHITEQDSDMPQFAPKDKDLDLALAASLGLVPRRPKPVVQTGDQPAPRLLNATDRETVVNRITQVREWLEEELKHKPKYKVVDGVFHCDSDCDTDDEEEEYDLIQATEAFERLREAAAERERLESTRASTDDGQDDAMDALEHQSREVEYPGLPTSEGE